MDAHTLVLQIIIWTLDVITILATIAFFCSFRKIEEKNDGLHMIFILTLVDLLSSLFNLCEIFMLQGPSDVNYVASIEAFLFRFSLFWSAAIGIFVHLVYKQSWKYTGRSFLLIAMAVCILLSSIFVFAICLNLWQIEIFFVSPGVYTLSTSSQLYGTIMYLVIFDGLGGIIPILVTLYCYYRVYCTLRDGDFSAELQARASRVFWYSFAQIICFVPEILMDLICAFANVNYSFGVGVIITFLYRSWGCLNLLIYWFLLPKSERRLSNYSLMLKDPDFSVDQTIDYINESSEYLMNQSTAESMSNSLIRSRTSSMIV